jgi:hypothetical protein
VYEHQAEGEQCGSLKDWNVTDLTDITGRVLERYYYDPYGSPEVVVDAHPFDWDDDGDVDATDIAACTTGGDCSGDYSGDCRRLDADADRDIDEDDFTIVSAYADSLPSSTALQRVPAATRSVLGNTFFHQGLVLDPELGTFGVGSRIYGPSLCRFLQPATFPARRGVPSPHHTAGNPYAHSPLQHESDRFDLPRAQQRVERADWERCCFATTTQTTPCTEWTPYEDTKTVDRRCRYLDRRDCEWKWGTQQCEYYKRFKSRSCSLEETTVYNRIQPTPEGCEGYVCPEPRSRSLDDWVETEFVGDGYRRCTRCK